MKSEHDKVRGVVEAPIGTDHMVTIKGKREQFTVQKKCANDKGRAHVCLTHDQAFDSEAELASHCVNGDHVVATYCDEKGEKQETDSFGRFERRKVKHGLETR
jgi:hypothetical protein